MSAAGVAAGAALTLLLLAVGAGLLRLLGLPPRRAGRRIVLSGLAGLLAWHLLLQLLTLARVPWSRPVLLASLALFVALPRWLARRRPARRGEPRVYSADLRLGWGDGTAVFSVLAFALLAPTLWITLPDFIYHWGLKGEHAFLARGIDYAWLARPWNWNLHPDYPHLLPILYGSLSILAGRFDAAALQLGAALFLGGTVLAARASLGGAGLPRGAIQGGTALVAFTGAAYSIGYLLAGGADGIIALALMAALPALLEAPSPGADLEIGIAAGFAAAAKIEGVPLAAFLIAVQLLRRAPGLWRAGREGLRRTGLASLALAGPALAVGLPWYLMARRYHLFQATNSGPFDLRRGTAILPALAEAMNAPELHHLPWAIALLPLLALSRRTRPAALVISAQLGFYLWAYFASALEPRFYVLSNFARLLFQLLPAVLVGALVAAISAIAVASWGEEGRRHPPEAGEGEGEGRRQRAAEEAPRPVEQVQSEGGPGLGG